MNDKIKEQILAIKDTDLPICLIFRWAEIFQRYATLRACVLDRGVQDRVYEVYKQKKDHKTDVLWSCAY